MSAAARAEARRKAILSRGTDRLAKLTTSARGEDAPAYLHDDPPLAHLPSTTHSARSFLGEDSSDMPSRSSLSPSPSPQPSTSTSRRGTTPSRNANIFESLSGNSAATDPSVWLPEQQQQFMQALMNASASPSLPSPFGEPQDPTGPMGMNTDNPFAALLGPQAAGDGAGGGGMPGLESMFPGMGMGKFPGAPTMAAEPPKPKSRLQKALPLLHLIAMWSLLAYFVLWAEPVGYSDRLGDDMGLSAVGIWRRWSDLGSKSPLTVGVMQRFRVQVVPFFWAFTTLQIVLHSYRIFSGFDAIQPPTLLALALPHLPPPFPALILSALKYMQMGSLFLDDLAGLVVGIGFIVYFSGWFAPVVPVL